MLHRVSFHFVNSVEVLFPTQSNVLFLLFILPRTSFLGTSDAKRGLFILEHLKRLDASRQDQEKRLKALEKD